MEGRKDERERRWEGVEMRGKEKSREGEEMGGR